MGLAYSEAPAAEGFAPQLVRIIFHNSSAAAGEGFKVDFHWQNAGDEPADRDYWIFVHFRPEGSLAEPYGPGGFSWDFQPARNTRRWQTGFVVKEEGCYFRVPAGIKPGRYTALVGMYDHENSLKRVPLQNKTRDVGVFRYRVGQVTVVEEPNQPSKVLAYRLVWRVRAPKPLPDLREPRYAAHGRIAVGFDPGRPVIRGWRVNGVDLPLGGDPGMQGPEAEFVSLDDNRYHTSLALDADWMFHCRIAGDLAVYKCRLRWKGKEVARFDIRYQLDRSGLRIRLSSLQESPEFHLLAVTLPSVVSVSETAPGAAMVVSNEGGRLVNITDSGRHRQVQMVSLRDPIPGAVISCHEAFAAVWVKSLDDQLISDIVEAGPKHGTLGVRFTTRVRARKPELEFAPERTSEFEVHVAGAQPGQQCSWIEGAKLLAKYFRARPTPLYFDALVYKVFLDGPGRAICTTFDEALQTIQRVYHLTNGATQIVYLVGFQHQGHSTGYPDIFSVNKRLGGMRGLKKLMIEAEKYSALVSFHDNFEHAYENSPAWDPSFVAMDGSGDLAQDGRTTGGQPYIISPKAYLESGKAQRRVDKSLESYPIRKTVHLDIMSAAPVRYDHNPKYSAGADDNMAARRVIIDMWRKRGVDVTSEGLTAPFVGLMSHFWNAGKSQEGGPYSSETPIPFVPFILHGKVTWGGGVDAKYGETLTLLYGATVSEDWHKDVSDQQITDRYYLLTLPWSKLADKEMVDYRREGNQQTVVYQGGDTVEANLETGTYRVTCGGYVIAENNVTMAPISRHELAVYSSRAQRLTVPFPAAWGQPEHLRVEMLTSDGLRTALDYRPAAHAIELDVPATRPIIISKR